MSREILWNIINAILAGGLIIAGAFTTGDVTIKSIVAAVGAATVVIITKFGEYWKNEEDEYKDECKTQSKVFSFIPCI